MIHNLTQNTDMSSAVVSASFIERLLFVGTRLDIKMRITNNININNIDVG